MRFFAKSPCPDGIGESLFLVASFQLFWGTGRPFFGGFVTFPGIRLYFSRNPVVPLLNLINNFGCTAGKTGFLEIWPARLYFSRNPVVPLVNHINHFSYTVDTTGFLEIWPARDPLRKKQLFQGVKPKKGCPHFFGGFGIHIKNTFCKKIGPKRPFQPSAVVRVIYTNLYGVATTN